MANRKLLMVLLEFGCRNWTITSFSASLISLMVPNHHAPSYATATKEEIWMVNDWCTSSSLNLCSLKNELSIMHFFNPSVLLSIAVNWWKLQVPGMVNTLIAFAMNFSSISNFFFLQKRKIWFHLYFHCKNQNLLYWKNLIFIRTF